MIGPNYWTTGVKITFVNATGQHKAELDFLDDGWADQTSTEGTLRARYYRDSSIADSVRLLLVDATKLGITYRNHLTKSPLCLYVPGDGEGDISHWPANWRELIQAAADELGWENIYKARENAATQENA